MITRAKTIVVRDADVQGMRTGITSPFYQGFKPLEPGRGDGSLLIEHGYFRDYVGVSVATAYRGSVESGAAPKRAVVRDSVFEPLAVPIDPWNPPATISMNHHMAPNDPEPRDPIAVYNYNATPATTSRFTTRSKRRLTSHRATNAAGGWRLGLSIESAAPRTLRRHSRAKPFDELCLVLPGCRPARIRGPVSIK